VGDTGRRRALVAQRASALMPGFAGIDHLSLTVTDLDVSERFYTDVLGFRVVMDFGYVRSLMHRPTGFFLSLIRHDEGTARPFSELHPGVDHIGLAAADREELLAWEDRFRDLGVEFTPVRDMAFGYHLNFRDPDGIALEFMAPNAAMTANLRELRDRDVPREEIRARVEEQLAAHDAARESVPT
jgi:catechol 2,3-dioxygenase-like lactoylglutathione lyase family enzyme